VCGCSRSYILGTEPLWTQALLQHLAVQVKETLHAVFVYGFVCGVGPGYDAVH
jgi:Ni,Fe-hydrogenase I small subunit